MKIQRLENGKVITLGSELGGGGEGKIYNVTSEPSLVAKIYHPEKLSQICGEKLKLMLAYPPLTTANHAMAIAWPVDLLIAQEDNKVVGFLMPKVTGGSPIHKFYTPKDRREATPFFDYMYLHRTARNLASLMRTIHASGYVIGDVNESNILVTKTALVRIVDTDSFQVRDPESGKVYRCPVGKPEFTPPELQGTTFRNLNRTPAHDLFALAVLIFQLLMEGTHPFDGVYQGRGETPSKKERIIQGHFPYGTKKIPYRPKPLAPSFKILHPSLQELFIRCFEDGYFNPSLRPDAETWMKAIDEAENSLITCSNNEYHLYGEHLEVCPWCQMAAKLGGHDSFAPQPGNQRKKRNRKPKLLEAALPLYVLQKIPWQYLKKIPWKSVAAFSVLAVTTVGVVTLPKLIPSEERIQLALRSQELKQQVDDLWLQYETKKAHLKDLSIKAQFVQGKIQPLAEQINRLELNLFQQEEDLARLSSPLQALSLERDYLAVKYDNLSRQLQDLIAKDQKSREAMRRILLLTDLIRIQKQIIVLNEPGNKETQRHQTELMAREQEKFNLEEIVNEWESINGHQTLRELSNMAIQVKLDYEVAQKNFDAQKTAVEFARLEVENTRREIEVTKGELVWAQNIIADQKNTEQELVQMHQTYEDLYAQHEQATAAANDPRIKIAINMRGDILEQAQKTD
ncbi:MAG: hypothetical protein DSM107014_14155 [Gomphosphaeria aponina SAG 52.96 = DSM 107014]|uniref:Protein kinase domain-containing protein n=1 Tax=Gomphosphaeria aponina SAG 52.96 = DSM 107014 TaxID=1521640 RepID=A0A941JN73_9CHRO|nr:hypothetical protein [Gomphosphaeria aponina SAG 52.96 = DSM 107014]